MKVLTFKNDTVSVGDIFVSSWGYEQTNVTFYRVLSVHGKKTVTVREIRANSEYTDSMVGFKTPVLNDFTGECFKRQIKILVMSWQSKSKILKLRIKLYRKKNIDFLLTTN